MLKALVTFWPALVPVFLLGIWFIFFRKRYKGSRKFALWESNLWLWVLAASLLMLVLTAGYIFYADGQGGRGVYVPAQYREGTLIPAHVVPEKEGNAQNGKKETKEKNGR